MNLKEAFRCQNKLQSFLDDAQSILDRDSNVTRVENTYLRHKVMAEAEDEAVLAVPEKDGLVSKRVLLAKQSEHFGSMSEKPSDFKVFGIFYGRKFSKYSMAQ